MADPRFPIRTYIPWVRRGLAALFSNKDTLGAGVPGRLASPVDLWVNDPTRKKADRKVAVPVLVYGPGDVTGIDPREVVRAEPRAPDGRLRAELLPVRRVRPARLRLDVHARRDRQRGQAAPVTLPRRGPQERAHAPTGHAPLAILDCPRASCRPDGVVGVGPRADLSTAAEPADRSTPTPWTPCSEAGPNGRSRGSSARGVWRRIRPTLPASCRPSKPAGKRASATRSPPTTNAVGRPGRHPAAGRRRRAAAGLFPLEIPRRADGDFESLARRLVPRQMPSTVGLLRRIDISQPGWGMPATDQAAPGAVLDLGGALQTSTVPRRHSQQHKPFQDALRRILNVPRHNRVRATIRPCWRHRCTASGTRTSRPPQQMLLRTGFVS